MWGGAVEVKRGKMQKDKDKAKVPRTTTNNNKTNKQQQPNTKTKKKQNTKQKHTQTLKVLYVPVPAASLKTENLQRHYCHSSYTDMQLTPTSVWVREKWRQTCLTDRHSRTSNWLDMSSQQDVNKRLSHKHCSTDDKPRKEGAIFRCCPGQWFP